MLRAAQETPTLTGGAAAAAEAAAGVADDCHSTHGVTLSSAWTRTRSRCKTRVGATQNPPLEVGSDEVQRLFLFFSTLFKYNSEVSLLACFF